MTLLAIFEALVGANAIWETTVCFDYTDSLTAAVADACIAISNVERKTCKTT